MTDEMKESPAWGYSKDEPEGHLFKDGKLPDGYYPNPAMVPGSEAEKHYKADAERDGAKVPWDNGETPKAPVEKPSAPAPADKAVDAKAPAPVADKAK